jgi:hypothetical protein
MVSSPLGKSHPHHNGKFFDDFVALVPVLATESIFWNGRKAWAPLPWVSVSDGNQLQVPAGEFDNQDADVRYCTFLDAQPAFAYVILLIRGIDGASCDLGSWTFLQQRYPRLQITLAFSCTELFVRSRVPEGENYFSRTDPYDGRLYGFFCLSRLVSSILRMSHDPKYSWLENEWRLGKQYRDALSMAHQGADDDDISNALVQFATLHTRGRNDLPFITGR